MGVAVGVGAVAVGDLGAVAPGRWRLLRWRWLPLVVMVVAVGVAAGMPLVGNHIFYFWDDSAAVGVPVWHRIAAGVLHGHLPLLNLDLWRGGDFSAEAATGLWNPVVVAVAVAVYPIDNLALGIALGKTFFMVLMAVGTYLLARDHRISPWLAAAVGTAAPLAGYSFFMDSVAWVNALMLTAFTPWVWWTARLVANNGRSPLWLVITGYLAVSIGNPYGFLVVGFVVLAVLIESRRRVGVLVLCGVAVGLFSVMVYLPLLLTAAEGFRAGSETMNNAFLKPSLTNLIESSTPSAQPFLINFGTPVGQNNLSVPVAYLAWFVLPTLPWLRWGALPGRWREHVGLYVFGAAFLLLMLGPSQVWMFRWPLRLIDFFWFPVLLLWGLLADQGLQRDRWRVRAAVSAAIVAVGAFLAWGELTGTWGRDVVGALVVLVLVAAVVRFGFPILILGSVVVLGVQLVWFPGNYTVADYQFPTSVHLLDSTFAKYRGTTVQLANLGSASDYRDLLYGSMYSVAGVDSTTAYSGIGFTPMDSALCQNYQGAVACPGAWTSLWRDPAGYGVPLVDLVRASTVVVQNSLIDTRGMVLPGWHRDLADEASGLTTVWVRDRALPYNGQLSDASAGVTVTGDSMVGAVGERVGFRADRFGELTFARLAWPGYRATVNGVPVTVRSGPDGLLTVDVPKGAGQVELAWRPPGYAVSLIAFVLGVALVVGLAVMRRA